MVYVLLLNRYYKYYEYSVNKPHLNNSALGAALIDLQRWRRRARQSLTKVKHITQFTNFHAPPCSHQQWEQHLRRKQSPRVHPPRTPARPYLQTSPTS